MDDYTRTWLWRSHYWQNPLWSGCLAASSDEVGQVRDSGLVRDSEPSAKVVPEAEAELGTGLSQAEEGVPAIASGVAAGSAADLAPGHLGADVVLRSVGVQRDLGSVEHPQEFRLVGVQPCKQPVQDDEAGPTRKEGGVARIRGAGAMTPTPFWAHAMRA